MKQMISRDSEALRRSPEDRLSRAQKMLSIIAVRFFASKRAGRFDKHNILDKGRRRGWHINQAVAEQKQDSELERHELATV